MRHQTVVEPARGFLNNSAILRMRAQDLKQARKIHREPIKLTDHRFIARCLAKLGSVSTMQGDVNINLKARYLG
jgi:hypothetical protein